MLLLAPLLGPPTYSTHSNWLFSKGYIYVACACILRPDKMKLLPVLVRTNYMSWGGGGGRSSSIPLSESVDLSRSAMGGGDLSSV